MITDKLAPFTTPDDTQKPEDLVTKSPVFMSKMPRAQTRCTPIETRLGSPLISSVGLLSEI